MKLLKRVLGGRASRLELLCTALALSLAIGGGAYAAGKISGKKLKNGSVSEKKLAAGVRAKLSGAGTPGTPGVQGPAGATGAAVYEGPHWGVVDRNTIGSPDAGLRSGPFAPGPAGSPPFGDGSLGLVAGSPGEKAAFGNEVDFTGGAVADLSQVGFRVYTTGENGDDNVPAPGTVNMPSIAFEVDPNGAGGTTTSFSTLVWLPSANSPSNQWSPYIDATADGLWGLTGGQFNSPATGANCGLNGPRCTFGQVKALLASGTGATILSAQVTKGRDYAWQGAVDGLRINDTVYDFEPFGVIERTP